MFSSEQIFKLSCDEEQLGDAIALALKWESVNNTPLCYQIVKNNSLAIGWYNYKATPAEGWTAFPVQPSIQTLVNFTKDIVKKGDYFVYPHTYDGTYEDGWLIENIPNDLSEINNKGVKKPFYGIILISYHLNFYAK